MSTNLLAQALPQAITEAGTLSGGEAILFWVTAPIMVALALGLLLSRRAVHSAISLIGVMICLAFIYTAQGATFMGVAQVVVYTGAIMMLFLFVIMLVGVDHSESLAETIRGHRVATGAVALGLLLVAAGVVVKTTAPIARGVELANKQTNPVGVAKLIFSDHVFTMELTGTLLIVAALGAVTLTHREDLVKKLTQRDWAEAKMAAYAAGTGDPRQHPTPGVYARTNATDVPALDAHGNPIEASVPRVLRVRGQERPLEEITETPLSPLSVEAQAKMEDNE